MYALTLNFETFPQLQAFVNSLPEGQSVAGMATTQAPAKGGKKGKAAAQEPAVLPPAQVAPQLAPAPAATTQPPAFALEPGRREAIIKEITDTNTKITSRGITGEQLGEDFGAIFQRLGIPMKKVGELNDGELAQFVMLYRDHMNAKYFTTAPTQQGASTANSFI